MTAVGYPNAGASKGTPISAREKGREIGGGRCGYGGTRGGVRRDACSHARSRICSEPRSSVGRALNMGRCEP